MPMFIVDKIQGGIYQMKIEGMDATLRTTMNVVNSQGLGKADIARKSVPEEQDNPLPNVSAAFFQKAVEKANKVMQIQGRSLEFKIHEKTNEIIVRIVDTETKEVVREIPSEKILDMFASMLELAGLLVDERR
jgi:flagellar protein FlaG